jgi:hypothetical protein
MGSRGMGVCWLPKARRDVRVSDTGRHVLGRRFISGIHVKAYAALVGLQCGVQKLFQNLVEAGGFVKGAGGSCAVVGGWEFF